MTALTEIQCILLAGAAARDSESLLPAMEPVVDDDNRLAEEVAALMKRGLVEERTALDLAVTWRAEGNDRLGLFITGAGLISISTVFQEKVMANCRRDPAAAVPERQSRRGIALALMQREQGVSFTELIEATGWLPHTARSSISSIKCGGYAVQKTGHHETAVYRILPRS